MSSHSLCPAFQPFLPLSSTPQILALNFEPHPRWNVDIDKLVTNNKGTYPALNKTVPLRAGTKLHLPPPTDPNAPPLPDWHLPCLNLLKKVGPNNRHLGPDSCKGPITNISALIPVQEERVCAVLFLGRQI